MPAIIIGSHLDSANYELPLHPVLGADDGGPGTVTIPEAFRTLVLIRFRSEVPVEVCLCTLEFSLAKTQSKNTYINAGTSGAMFQSDMTACIHKGATPTMGPSLRRYAPVGLGYAVARCVFYIAARGREMIVRRLYKNRPVSRNEDLLDVAQMVYPTTFRGTVLGSQWYVLPRATQPGPPTCASMPSMAGYRKRRLTLNVSKYALEFTKVALGSAVELGMGWLSQPKMVTFEIGLLDCSKNSGLFDIHGACIRQDVVSSSSMKTINNRFVAIARADQHSLVLSD